MKFTFGICFHTSNFGPKNNSKFQLISWKFLKKYKLYQMLSVSYRTVMIVKKACDTNAFIDPVGCSQA